VAGSVSQQDDATCRRKGRGNCRIVAGLLGFALAAQLAVLPVAQVMKKVVWIVWAQRSRGLRRTRDRKQTCLMVIDGHDHIEWRGFGCALFLDHLDRSRRHARTFQKPAQLPDLLWRQRFGMMLVEYVSLLTDLHKKPAVMFLARRTEPLGEVQSVRPGDIARNRVPENRLECAPIPIQDPVRRRQLALPRYSTDFHGAPRLRVIHTTSKREPVARARQ
jgi:hypothetical protein